MKEQDAYFSQFKGLPLDRLNQMREICRSLIPGAEECMRYGIPTFRLNEKNLVHFAAYKNHTGFYPGAACMKAFEPEFIRFKTGPGSVQFNHKDELPVDLIRRMILFCKSHERNKDSKKNQENRESQIPKGVTKEEWDDILEYRRSGKIPNIPWEPLDFDQVGGVLQKEEPSDNQDF